MNAQTMNTSQVEELDRRDGDLQPRTRPQTDDCRRGKRIDPIHAITDRPGKLIVGRQAQQRQRARSKRDHIDKHEAGKRDQHQPSHQIAQVRAERTTHPFIGRAGVLAPHIQPLEGDRDEQQRETQRKPAAESSRRQKPRPATRARSIRSAPAPRPRTQTPWTRAAPSRYEQA